MLLVPEPVLGRASPLSAFRNLTKKMFTRTEAKLQICPLHISSFSSLVTGGTCLDNSPNDGQSSAALERPP